MNIVSDYFDNSASVGENSLLEVFQGIPLEGIERVILKNCVTIMFLKCF